MNKSIAKEIIIGLLLCLAILLVLAILLYGYIPNNKLIPELVAYTTPEEAKEVLKETQVDTSKVILTYEVNGSDLSTAQKTNSYKAGKVNPFSSYISENENNTDGTTNNSNTGESAENQSNSSETNTNDRSLNGGTSSSSNSSSSEGTYYKNKGTK